MVSLTTPFHHVCPFVKKMFQFLIIEKVSYKNKKIVFFGFYSKEIKVIFALHRCYLVFRRNDQKQPCRGVLGKSNLKLNSKFTGKHPCQSAISRKCLNFIEITLRHGFSPVNVMHVFRICFLIRTPKDGCFWSDSLKSPVFYSFSKVLSFFC